MGYQVEVIERPIDGDVETASKVFCERLGLIAERSSERPVCLIGGGEPTVILGSSPGRGGRNQQFALASAFEIQGKEDLHNPELWDRRHGWADGRGWCSGRWWHHQPLSEPGLGPTRSALES